MKKEVKLKYRKINLKLENFDGYVTKIESIIGTIKNITVEVEIKKIKVYEYKDSISLFCNIEDNTGSMAAFLIGSRGDMKEIVSILKENNRYLIYGNVSIPNMEDLKEISTSYDNLDKEFDLKKILFVKAIEKI